MNKYNHWLGKLFGCINGNPSWAITLGQTTYYSVPAVNVNERWQRHEDCHKRQWGAYGILKFASLYVWYQLRYNYAQNPFEIEAKACASQSGGPVPPI